MMPTSSGVTYDATDMARLLDISTWQVYEHCRRGDFPFEPIRVGRLLRWPRSTVDQALGVLPVADNEPLEANNAEQSRGPDGESVELLDSPLDLDEVRRIASEMGHPLVETEDGGWTFGTMPPEGTPEFSVVQKRVLDALGFRPAFRESGCGEGSPVDVSESSD